MSEQLEGRNPVLEALIRRRRRVLTIWVDERARPERRLDRILQLARERGVAVIPVARRALDRRSEGGVHNGVIARAESLPRETVAGLLAAAERAGRAPCLVLADALSYEHNLGAVLRSALGAGADGVVVPTRRGKGITPVVARVAMGGAEAVPVVREGLSSALSICRRAGLKVVGADMKGRPFWEVDLTGPLALVLGGESRGLSSTLRKRCDEVVSIPLRGDLESLNVSVSAAVLLFERVRQEAAASGGG